MTAAPITTLTTITDVDQLTEMAETYATMTDELATMIEVSDVANTVEGRLMRARLGMLHVELDELTITEHPTHNTLVRISNQVSDLRAYAAAADWMNPAVAALLAPLAELHDALLDQITVLAQRVIA